MFIIFFFILFKVSWKLISKYLLCYFCHVHRFCSLHHPGCDAELNLNSCPPAHHHLRYHSRNFILYIAFFIGSEKSVILHNNNDNINPCLNCAWVELANNKSFINIQSLIYSNQQTITANQLLIHLLKKYQPGAHQTANIILISKWNYKQGEIDVK